MRCELDLLLSKTNIDHNKSEFSFTVDFNEWANRVNSFIPEFINTETYLRYFTAPTTSYYDKFLMAKSEIMTLTELENRVSKINDIVLYTIEQLDDSYVKVRYDLLSNAR